MRDTNIEVAPEYEKITLIEALVSDMNFEFEVYTHDKTKCDAYKTELDTYKASLEVYKVTTGLPRHNLQSITQTPSPSPPLNWSHRTQRGRRERRQQAKGLRNRSWCLSRRRSAMT